MLLIFSLSILSIALTIFLPPTESILIVDCFAGRGAKKRKRGWEIAWNQLTDARFLERYTTTERVYKCDGNGPLRPQPLEPIDCQYSGDDCGELSGY